MWIETSKKNAKNAIKFGGKQPKLPRILQIDDPIQVLFRGVRENVGKAGDWVFPDYDPRNQSAVAPSPSIAPRFFWGERSGWGSRNGSMGWVVGGVPWGPMGGGIASAAGRGGTGDAGTTRDGADWVTHGHKDPKQGLS